MEDDGFVTDLAQEPERPENKVFTIAGGVRYWPTLTYAPAIGYRPIVLNLRGSGGQGAAPAAPISMLAPGILVRRNTTTPPSAFLRMEERLLNAGCALARVSYRLSGEAKWPAHLEAS